MTEGGHSHSHHTRDPLRSVMIENVKLNESVFVMKQSLEIERENMRTGIPGSLKR
jgi:hypothetical protein